MFLGAKQTGYEKAFFDFMELSLTIGPKHPVAR